MSEQQKQAENRARPTTEEFRSFVREDWAPRRPTVTEVSAAAAPAAARRAALSATFPGERLVVPAGGLKVRSNDTDYVFRPHTAFAYLTGLGADREPDAVLVLEPLPGEGAGHEAVLYVRPLADRDAAERLAAAQAGLDIPIGQRLIGLLGVASMLAIAWLMSYDRKSINWRLIATGLGLQALFGFIVLKTEAGRAVFRVVGDAITSLLGFQEQGARFVFGNLVQSAVPVTGDGATPTAMMAQTGAFFAFNVLPTIIFFSALMSVLYYLGIMQLIVEGLARVMQRTLGTSGAETLSASGNIFLGQTEAPLLIKPFVARMTRSELNTVMVGGFATVAGGVLAAYVGMLSGVFPGIAAHLESHRAIA